MYNKVILVGRLTRDIELRYSPAGMSIANTAIATNHNYTSNGEKKEEVCYTDITFFARSAEIANQYLRKGSQILVEGRLRLDQWTDQSGQKRSKHSVVVETMQMLDSKGDNQGANNNAIAGNAPLNNGNNVPAQGQAQQPSYNNNQVQQPSYNNNQAQQQTRQVPSSESVPEIAIDDDEIPF